MTDLTHMLAQKPEWEISNLLYLLFFLVLPALNGAVAWYKQRLEKRKQENQGEEILDAEIEEAPPTPDMPPQPIPPRHDQPPTRRTDMPRRPGPVARPVPHPAESSTRPVAQPVPLPRTMSLAREDQRRPESVHQVRPATPPRDAPSVAEARHPVEEVIEAVIIPAEPTGGRRRMVSASPPRSQAAPPPETLEKQKSLREDLTTIESIRRAVILSEILAPPVALRGPGDAPFSRID